MEKIVREKNPTIKVIKQVYGNKKQSQKLVTIPNWATHIKNGDWVEIIKVRKEE